MTEQDFIASMRVLFSTWYGVENAHDVLSDVIVVIGEECFGMEPSELRELEAACKGYSADLPPEEPPPALKLAMERDLKGAVAMGKVWGEVFDSLFSSAIRALKEKRDE